VPADVSPRFWARRIARCTLRVRLAGYQCAEISDEEGDWLQLIVRRGSGPVVTWRRGAATRIVQMRVPCDGSPVGG